MRFSRTVELPVWETRTDDLLKGERGILGVSACRRTGPEELPGLLRAVKQDQHNPFPVLLDLTAIDESQRMRRPTGETHRFTVQYLLFSPDRMETLLVKVPLEGDSPKLPSSTGVYRNADWYEREVFDMFGIGFEGHPNLRRILMPDWWTGHPLRKDHPGRGTEIEPLVIGESELKEYDGYEVFHEGDSTIQTRNELGEEVMVLNLGPNHPGTHGVLRVVLKLNGEYMEDVVPVIGYHHRGNEKIAERHSWHTFIPYCDRVDYLAGTYNEFPYVMACERLAGIEVPERAQCIRVMMGEIFRICNHLVWFGTFGHDVGAMTPVFYTFREREKLFKIVEMITGGRMHPNYLRLGGVAMDLPPGWQEPLKMFLKDFSRNLLEYDKLMLGNPIFRARTRGVGKMSLSDCWEWGVSGPNLRAAGTDFDLRKRAPYSGYDQYEFNIPTHTDGDCLARGIVRHAEMYESAKIIEQCIRKMPGGDTMSRDNRFAFPPRKAETMHNIETLITHFLAVGWGLDLPAGESFCMVEQPKGISGYHVVSDGRSSPYRLRIRAPSFAHMQTLPALTRGHLISDLLAVIGAMDYVLADVDR